MTTLERLDRWHRGGLLTDDEHHVIAAIVRKERFSVFLELNALLYIGVLAIAGGLAWTIRTSFEDFGDAAILLVLSVSLIACFYYCFTRGRPYSAGQIESPTLAFDYVLYLGCLVFGIELAYLEIRFQVFRNAWDYHVFLPAALFFALAYRFDNRFVLSLALSTLAAWFGIKLSNLGFDSPAALRPSALAYGALIAGAGLALHRIDIKKHFLETYLHVAVNVVLLALLSGTAEGSFGVLYLLALLALSAVVIWVGSQHRAFAFVAYGVIYAYAGITAQLLRHIAGPTSAFLYFVVSGIAVLILLVYLARTFGREQ
ncbi:MAG: DUF2157 domain-containing protein [Vicinamibacterales bacterium]